MHIGFNPQLNELRYSPDTQLSSREDHYNF